MWAAHAATQAVVIYGQTPFACLAALERERHALAKCPAGEMPEAHDRLAHERTGHGNYHYFGVSSHVAIDPPARRGIRILKIVGFVDDDHGRRNALE